MYFYSMFNDDLPALTEKPLVDSLQASGRSQGENGGQQALYRDLEILEHLKDRLKNKRKNQDPHQNAEFSETEKEARPRDTQDAVTSYAPNGDSYHQQRISRKICWQYNQSGHKVPMLGRSPE